MNVRVAPTQKKLPEKAAEASGQSISAFVLDHALQAAHRALGEVQNCSFSVRNARLFMAAFLKYDEKYFKKTSN